MFYHLCTNNTDFSRQACAEPIAILPDSSIPQVEITTQGMDGKPIPAKGSFPAAMCCNLTTGKPRKLGLGKPQTCPRITEADGETIVGDMVNGTELGYKYFITHNLRGLKTTYRCTGNGKVEVRMGDSRSEIPITPCKEWTEAVCGLPVSDGISALTVRYRGCGKLDLKEIIFVEG